MRLHSQGMTMLIAEQSVSLALEIADYGYVLQTGRTVLAGDAQSLADNPEVQRVYMGISTAPVMAH
jgi:branched-chain amino acid transport system ATP-binding protein